MEKMALCFLFLCAIDLCAESPEFKMQTIDDKVGIGYGVQLADMNADGKTDILLVDKDKVAWYENPHWQKHIVVNHLTKRDHVCLTARDLDGDGRAELAMGEVEPRRYASEWCGFIFLPTNRAKEFGVITPSPMNQPLTGCIGSRARAERST